MKEEILWMILGMALVTYLPRFIPLAFLTRWTIPQRVKPGLNYIPIAILSAIIFPILFSNGEGNIGIQPQFLLAAIPTSVFAWKVRSLWGTVVLGMLTYWVLGFVL